MAVKYPDVKVQLSGGDGNAFVVIGICTKAAKRAGVPKSEIDTFMNEMMSGDYDHLLRTAQDWFTVR